MNIAASDFDRRERLADYTSVIGMGIRFAFQPVVDLDQGRVSGYEALVRGRSGEPAGSIIANVLPENLAFFDQACRSRAISNAAGLGMLSDLFLNCTHINPDNLDLALTTTREQAELEGLSADRIVLEFASLTRLGNPRELASVRDRAHAHGFRVLADNYGIGEAGLKRLAVFCPDYVKLDREIVNQIHVSRRRQAIVLGIVGLCRALDIGLIATGVERQEEVHWLQETAGVTVFQGYYYAKPALMAKPQVDSSLLDSEPSAA